VGDGKFVQPAKQHVADGCCVAEAVTGFPGGLTRNAIVSAVRGFRAKQERDAPG